MNLPKFRHTLLWRYRPHLLLLLMLLGPLCAQAKSPVRIQFDQAIQPFVLPENQSGLLVDIVRAAFAAESIEITPVFLPAARAMISYREKEVDVLTDLNPKDTIQGVISSWPVLTFRNVAITAKSKRLTLSSIADLQPLRVEAFQHARRVLGEDFARMAANNKRYTERSIMPSKMLLHDRTDAMISQGDIFLYNLIKDDGRTASAFYADALDFHPILGSGSVYWFGFRNQKLRDQFERGIQTIYRNGQIDQLFKKYADLFGTSRDMFIELDCRFAGKPHKRTCPVR